MSAAPPELPADGLPAPDVLAELRANRHDDADWRNGRIFGLIFHPDDDELEELLADVSREYLAENALNPMAFPSLARLELRLFVGTLIRRYPRLRLVSTPTFGGLPLPRDRVSLEVQLHEP